jgi:molybdopterin-guanine dinucleotide biosynthesis protein A
MAGMEHATTPWLISVPCDSPGFPDDLVARLAQAASDADAQIAMPVTLEEGERRTQPVFCLMQTQLLESLVAYTQGGGRKIDAWTAQHRVVEVPFDDARAFFNANTLAELQQLQ